MYGETLDFQCQHLQRNHGKVLTANLLQKLISDRIFYVIIADTDIESLKLLRTLFDIKYLDTCMVRNIRKFQPFGKKCLRVQTVSKKTCDIGHVNSTLNLV